MYTFNICSAGLNNNTFLVLLDLNWESKVNKQTLVWSVNRDNPEWWRPWTRVKINIKFSTKIYTFLRTKLQNLTRQLFIVKVKLHHNTNHIYQQTYCRVINIAFEKFPVVYSPYWVTSETNKFEKNQRQPNKKLKYYNAILHVFSPVARAPH